MLFGYVRIWIVSYAFGQNRISRAHIKLYNIRLGILYIMASALCTQNRAALNQFNRANAHTLSTYTHIAPMHLLCVFGIEVKYARGMERKSTNKTEVSNQIDSCIYLIQSARNKFLRPSTLGYLRQWIAGANRCSSELLSLGRIMRFWNCQLNELPPIGEQSSRAANSCIHFGCVDFYQWLDWDSQKKGHSLILVRLLINSLVAAIHD